MRNTTSPEVDSVRVKLFNLTVGQFLGTGVGRVVVRAWKGEKM